MIVRVHGKQQCCLLIVLIGFLLTVYTHANTLNQPGLHDLIKLALNSHPLLQQADSNVREAEENLKAAKWQRYPTPVLALRSKPFSGNSPQTQGDDFSASIGLSQPLWSGGRLTASIEKADANLASRSMSYEESRRDLALRVIRAYGNWFNALRKLNVRDDSVINHQKLYNNVQLRVSEGMASESDLSLAEGRLQTAVAEQVSAQAEHSIAISIISQLTGDRFVPEQYSGSLELPKTIVGNFASLIAQAEAIDPGVKILQARAREIAAEVAIRKSDRWPDISLRVEHQSGLFDQLDRGSDTRVFIEMQTKLGAGLSNAASISAAAASRHSVTAELAVRKRELQEEMIADYALYNSIDSRLKAIKTSLASNRGVFESYKRQFASGRKSWLEVMNTARDMEQTRLQLADTESAHLLVSWRLYLKTHDLAALDSDW